MEKVSKIVKPKYSGIATYTTKDKNRLTIPPDYITIINERNRIELKNTTKDGTLDSRLDFLGLSFPKDISLQKLLEMLNTRIYLERLHGEKEVRVYNALDYAIKENTQFVWYDSILILPERRIGLPNVEIMFPELLLMSSAIQKRKEFKTIAKALENDMMVYGRRDYFTIKPSLLVYFESLI